MHRSADDLTSVGGDGEGHEGQRLNRPRRAPRSSRTTFCPRLQKPQQTVGEFISIAGRDWSGCPAADKDKMFRCVVRKFDAVHDFGAFKSAGFKVQEMGESVARAVFKNELGA